MGKDCCTNRQEMAKDGNKNEGALEMRDGKINANPNEGQVTAESI